MRTLYLDCSMGAAGDMLCAALLQLHPAPEQVLEKIRALKLPGVTVALEQAVSQDIVGAHFSVTVDGRDEGEGLHDHHHHYDDEKSHGHEHEHHCDDKNSGEEHHHHHHVHLADVNGIIRGSGLDRAVIDDALAVYALLARAESEVHGTTVDQIHFHEVGTLDAVVDVLTACLLLRELAPERVVASPVHVGSGTVRCAHGVLPVPAPATARLLEGIPSYAGDIVGELCTPTGAALLKHFVSEFSSQPLLRVERIGYGVGHKVFPRANVLRAMLGEEEPAVVELSCNLDDTGGEDIAFALQSALDAGALDAWWEPIGMKKSRPAVRLSVLCRREDRDQMVALIFKHTRTIGIREALCRRYVLRRESGTVESPWGPVRVKRSEGWGVERVKAEADDLARIARENGLTLDEIRGNLQGL